MVTSRGSGACVGIAVLVVRPAGAGVELLYLRRSGGRFVGQWWPVAGTLEPGEPPLACARRELQEETGLVPETFHATGATAPHENGRDHLAIFVALVAADAEPRLNAEHDARVWRSPAEARAATPTVGHPHLDMALVISHKAGLGASREPQ
jgi:8-oxo-dGTP pyrophosphatase MutT (NUDIX family)